MTEKGLTMRLNRPKLGVGVKTWAALSAIFWVPMVVLISILTFLFQNQSYKESVDSIQVYFKGAKEIYGERGRAIENLLVHASDMPDVQDAFFREDSQKLQNLLLGMEKNISHAQIWIAVDENQRVIGSRGSKTGNLIRIGDALSKALTTGQVVSATELVSKEFMGLGDEGNIKSINDVGIVQFVIAPVRHKEGISGAIIAGIVISGETWLGNTIHNKFGAEMAIFAGQQPESSFLHATASLPRNTWIIGQPFPKELKNNVHLGRPYYGALKIGDVEHMVAFEPITDSQNRMIGSFGVSTLSGDMLKAVYGILMKGTAAAVLVGLILAIIAVVFTYRDIARPIKFLVGAMEGFGRGDLNTTVDLKTGDEFEKLGEGFNIMADGIRKREERLGKHYEIAKLLMSTLDLRELVEKMLKIVVNVTNSQMGILYLSEEGEEQVLIPHVHYGTKSELATLKIGEGHPGRAAMDKKTIIINTPTNLVDEVMELGYAKAVPNEVAYIPLVYKEKVLGVLVLGTVKEYSEEDRHIFEYLSGQISIALDNAIMHQKIQELSITDPLTRLYNRRYLNTRMVEEWARTIRHNKPLTILLSDADNFKKINDNFGHDKGDEVLKGIAEIVRKNIRKEDIGARFGGEEFVIVLPDTSSKDALVIAERIRGCSEAKFYEWAGRPVTLSIGLATFPDLQLKSFEELVQAADQAMYAAKLGGKNRVVVSEGVTS